MNPVDGAPGAAGLLMLAPSGPKSVEPPRLEIVQDSGSERRSVGPPPEIETDSDVDSATHRDRRREDAERRREGERRRREQADQERVQEAARARAMERDRDINDLISRCLLYTSDAADE